MLDPDVTVGDRGHVSVFMPVAFCGNLFMDTHGHPILTRLVFFSDPTHPN